jgi:hypothetical protein
MVAVARARLAAGAILATLLISGAAGAQMQRPDIKVTATPIAAPVKAGGTVTVRLAVRLPQDVHVQADKPRDPSLIPTALTLVPPAGFSVEKITYPKASDLSQAGRAEPLAVFGGEFIIEARLAVPPGIAPGEHQLLATLRYQACNETLCFAPARAAGQWTITVTGAGLL